MMVQQQQQQHEHQNHQHQQQRLKTPTHDDDPPRIPRHKTPPRSPHSSMQQQQQQEELEQQYRRHQQQQQQLLHQQSQQQHHRNQQQLPQLIENQQWSLVIQRLEKHPDEATTVVHTEEGDLPLHWACHYQPPLEIINALLQLHEAAIQIKTNHDGVLPLHLACKNGASADVVARLLMSYPSATRLKDRRGQLPLHLAVVNGASEDVLLALLMVSPKAATTRNPNGQTPIDLATSTAAKKAMKRAPLLLALSKAATNKLTHDHEVKLREVVQVYQDRITTVKTKYEEERTRAMAIEVQLRQELWQEREKSNTLQEQVDELQHQYQETQQRLQQQELLLEHIQGLISQHSRREERSSNGNSAAEDNMTTTTPTKTKTRPAPPPRLATSQPINRGRDNPMTSPAAGLPSSPPRSPSSIDVAMAPQQHQQQHQKQQHHNPYQDEEQEPRHYHNNNNHNTLHSSSPSPRPLAPLHGPGATTYTSRSSAHHPEESRQDLDDHARLAKLAMQHWIEQCASGVTTAYMVEEDDDVDDVDDKEKDHGDEEEDPEYKEIRDPAPRERIHSDDPGRTHPYLHQEHQQYQQTSRPRLQSKSQEWDPHNRYETVSTQSPPVVYSQSLLTRSKQQPKHKQVPATSSKYNANSNSSNTSSYKGNGTMLAARVTAEHKQRRARGETMMIRRQETNMPQRERYDSKTATGSAGNPPLTTTTTTRTTPPAHQQPPKSIYSTRQGENQEKERSRALSHSPERPRRSINAATLLGQYSDEDEDPTILSRVEWS